MVISDTSPICYLVLIGEIEALHRVFGELCVPAAVARELNHPGAPTEVRAWLDQAPDWLLIDRIERSIPGDLKDLHSGEQQAILLAEAVDAPWIVLDERQARRCARDRGLQVTGLLGVLARDAEMGHSDLREALARLEQTTFHIAPSLLAQVLQSATDAAGSIKGGDS